MISLARRAGFQKMGQQLEGALRVEVYFMLVIFGSEFFWIREQAEECGLNFIPAGSAFQQMPPSGLNPAAVRNPVGRYGLDLQAPVGNRLELGLSQAGKPEF